MSYEAQAWALRQRCTAGAKLVLIALCDAMNHETRQCNPQLDDIASMCGITRRSIDRHVMELKSRGLIKTEQRGQLKTDFSFPDYHRQIVGAIKLPPTISTVTTDKLSEEHRQIVSGTNQERTKKNQGEKARPKSVTNVIEYFASIDQPASEAERFFDHFESNGWKVGGRGAMKDWKASARNWARRSKEFGNDKRKSTTDIQRELLSDSGSAFSFDGATVPIVPSHPGGQLIEHQENVGGAPAGISARGHREGGEPDD